MWESNTLMSNNLFEAIIFDLDGTLIDTETSDFEACKMLYKEFGITLSMDCWAEKVVGNMDYGLLFKDLLQRSNNGMTTAELQQRLYQLWDITFQDIKLMPGVEKLISALHTAGYPLGVGTASDQKWAMRWLTHFNLLPYFQAIANGDEISHNKPAPDIYLLVAAQLGVQPRHCLVFEDSLVGVQSAKAAGMTVIAVPSHVTKSLDFSQADSIRYGLQTVTIEWLEAFAKRCLI